MSKNLYYVQDDQEEISGPYSLSEIKQLINQHTFHLEQLISKSEHGPWVTIREFIVLISSKKSSQSSQSGVLQAPQQSSITSGVHAKEKQKVKETARTSGVHRLETTEAKNPPAKDQSSNQSSIITRNIGSHSSVIKLTEKNESSTSSSRHTFNQQELLQIGPEEDVVIEQETPAPSHETDLPRQPTPTASQASPGKSRTVSRIQASITYFTLLLCVITLGALGYVYYTSDVLEPEKKVVGKKSTEEIVPVTVPVNLTVPQANLLLNLISDGFKPEKVVNLVDQISKVQDEQKLALLIEQLKLDLSRLQLWMNKNKETFAQDQEVSNELHRLIKTREMTILLAEALRFSGFIPWNQTESRFSRETTARSEKLIILKVYQPKVEQTPGTMPWIDQLVANKPKEIPDPQQRGMFIYYNADDWAKYIDQQEELIIQRLKDLL